MSVDWSEVEKLADDLEIAADDIRKKVLPVVRKGAVNVKNDMRRDATGHPTYRHFPRSITYDEINGGLGAEIGPDKDLVQGALGNLLYFGTDKTNGVLNINPPLDKEAPRFERALADVAEDIL
ncbi:hypothetical protein [Amycolatopsis orientalis]|uniref:hypothetical protein n=1 Tax=Amycolatopsis orientalis TaxID=31958 RepID=UPI00039AD7B5|nr:hypothetical protein [Amycolatopsis orientalis]